MSDYRFAANGPVRFGAFELDASAGELRKHGLRIRLQDQPLQILQILLEKPGQLVTREELQRRLWPSNTYVEFDKGIYNAIKRLRETLSDDAETPRYIETIPRHGYRFIGPVEQLANRTSEALAAVTVDSIAVLPFTRLSADPEDDFFADGMTEEIINALAQIKELDVVARSSAFQFKGKRVDPRIIGEQLKVHKVLEGSVRRVGDCLRITVQLINASDGYQLWSERYDRAMKDVFEIQDEIARSIAERLKVTLKDGQERLVKPRTENLEAYQLYVKARTLLYRRGSAIPHAMECLERAVKLDPRYALAWAGLADSYTTQGYYGLVPPGACMPKGMEAARRAVALDPSLAEAHNALAMAYLMGAWDKTEAEREFLSALELNPRYIQARGWYALFYLQYAAGRLEDGVTQAKLALEDDPLSSYAHGLYSLSCAQAGRYTESLQASERAVQLDPECFLARWFYQVALYCSRRLEEAVVAGEVASAMSGRHPWAMIGLAVAFADLNQPAGAEAIYAELMARARQSYVSPSALALAAAAAGIEAEAIRHAREAFAMRDPTSLFLFSKIAPASPRLRAYPLFHEIPADMGWLLK